MEHAGSEASGLPISPLEPILYASFASKHRHIVNATLVMWNHIYSGYVGMLDYPERLREALITLQVYVDTPIPGLDITHVLSGGAQEPLFVEDEDSLKDAVITLSSADTHMDDIDNTNTPRPTTSSGKLHATPTHTPLSATSPSSVNRASNSKSSKKSAKKDKLLRREKNKSTPARLRHDDSQIEFTAIDFPSAAPSSAAASATKDVGVDVVEESQILTERQREVRDRQRETNALYSDVMSSSPTGEAAARKMAAMTMTAPRTVVPVRESSVSLPQQPQQAIEPALALAEASLRGQGQEEDQEKQTSSPAPEDVALPEQVRAATPEPAATAADAGSRSGANKAEIAAAEDEFIASTPTPRRGQALVFADGTHDNEIDSPSSPPEPRRYPLLPDISSRSRSSSILDDWQFSSSPLSGSPIAARHTLPEPELSIDGVLEASLRDRLQQEQEQGEEAEQTTVASKPAADDVDMEDVATPVPAPALAAAAATTSSHNNLTVEISPLAHKKSRAALASPATPRQTRRQSALSQETTSQENHADDESSVGGGLSGDISFSGSVSASASVPQSLPRPSRKNRRASSSKAVAQSSPIRSSNSSSGSINSRRYRLMAMPPPSMHNVSFRMSDGEERSMLRLAIELDMVNKQSQSQSSPAPSAPPSTRSSSKKSNKNSLVDLAALDCITVWTSDEKAVKSEDDDLRANSLLSSQNATPSQRSRRRKRKRSASARAEEEAAAAAATSSPAAERKLARARRHASEARSERSERSERSQKTASPVPAAVVVEEEEVVDIADTTADITEDIGMPSSPSKNGMADETASVGSEGDHDVQSQLALEFEELSSRNKNVVDLTSVADVADDAEPASVVEVAVEVEENRPAKKPRLAGILSMLRSSLSLLQAATLSREEVGQIEDVCMDVKRALYDAERRGRD